MHYVSMTTKTHGQTRRAAARHAAYREAARALKLAALDVPPDAVAYVDVYFRERARLLEWLDYRGRGVLASPPGGSRGGLRVRR